MKNLTASQLAALVWAYTHKGFVSVGGNSKSGVVRRTIDALVAMELLAHHASERWVHGGGGTRHQFRLTRDGQMLTSIGAMLATFEQ